jgi:hypothetical protein
MTLVLPALFPIREEGVLRIFIPLKYPSPWPDFEPATFGSSSQHTNHYTTKATTMRIVWFLVRFLPADDGGHFIVIRFDH